MRQDRSASENYRVGSHLMALPTFASNNKSWLVLEEIWVVVFYYNSHKLVTMVGRPGRILAVVIQTTKVSNFLACPLKIASLRLKKEQHPSNHPAPNIHGTQRKSHSFGI